MPRLAGRSGSSRQPNAFQRAAPAHLSRASLANSAVLAEKSYAYMIWGVNDDTHEVVGTTVRFEERQQTRIGELATLSAFQQCRLRVSQHGD